MNTKTITMSANALDVCYLLFKAGIDPGTSDPDEEIDMDLLFARGRQHAEALVALGKPNPFDRRGELFAYFVKCELLKELAEVEKELVDFDSMIEADGEELDEEDDDPIVDPFEHDCVDHLELGGEA